MAVLSKNAWDWHQENMLVYPRKVGISPKNVVDPKKITWEASGTGVCGQRTWPPWPIRMLLTVV